jgi:carbamoyl-phosphate synthase large subunit
MSSISVQKFPKSGQTYKAIVDSFDQVRESAEIVSKKLGVRGPVNIQTKFDGTEARVFEINPRLSATAPIRTVAGINEPDILYRNWVLNENIQVKKYKKMLCLRYWNEIYVKMDSYNKLSNSGEMSSENSSFIVRYF